MEKVLSSVSTIRFQDCDPYNHLNNAQYINYFMNAREDQVLLNYNLDVYKNAIVHKKAWVVGTNQIAYLNPAFLMEKVVIESQVIAFGPKTITIEGRMWNEDKSHLKSFIWVSLVYFDMNESVVAKHDEETMALFENIYNPIEQNSFEERLGFFRLNK